ncbi:BTAD domain-containing putative transcriptional regulator [Streptomyces sp. NPDC088387]|uniref:BTAD domain-containing putative transcriptional regulator n=1 Tax=Streptomyces sp. NPDC088387 TaxID=3365859 RepID=UPI00381F914A
MLGPLEVLRDGTPLELSGVKPRSVLSYLLLRPNRVTATSELVAALWQGAPPVSARKMVQNAVWRLRALLDTDGQGIPSDAVSLRSRPPGYLLEVHPHALDLHRFHDLVAEGRSRMREGSVATASLRWRAALDLWRGPMLSDLVEAGVGWPELEATETTRLDVLEEYFDAELALGRHHAVIPELQALSRAEPWRERFVGQLMLALHRGGRHSEALDAYTAIRTELAEQLGLEPGRRLQELQQAILADDPALHVRPLPTTARATTVRPDPPASVQAAPLPTAPEPTAPRPAVTARPGERVRERREVSVAWINASVPAGDDRGDPERIDEAMASLHNVVGDEANRFDGTVAARIGSFWLVVFGAGHSRGNEPMKAVLMVLAVRHRLRRRRNSAQGLRIRAAVDTGDALVRYAADGGPPTVTSTALDRAQSLLPLVPLDEVWVSEDTREQSASRIDYQRARVSSAMWTVRGIRTPGGRDGGLPLIDRTEGVRTLAGMLDRDRTGPGVALVVGEAGMGKSSMLVEFERLAARRAPAERPLLAHVFPCTVDDSLLGVVATELCASCGIGADDPPETARDKLWTTIERVIADSDEACRVFERLLVAIGHVPDHEPAVVAEEMVAAWLTLLEGLATERPVVLIVDDLHGADENLLRIIDRLAVPAGPGRLGVVAAARPELFHRRPDWTRAPERIVTVELPRLSDDAVARQTRMIIETSGSPDLLTATGARTEALRELTDTVTALADGNPMFAAEFVRLALRRACADTPAAGDGGYGGVAALIPTAVRGALQARLDELPADLRTVAQDAALIGDAVWPETLAALQRRRDGEVTAALDELTRRGVLTTLGTGADGPIRFAFRQPLLREVAYARVPQGLRAAKHTELAGCAPGSRAPGERRRPVAPELLRLYSVVERLRR